MSGGHFRYEQHYIVDIADEIERVVATDASAFSPETIRRFEMAIQMLRIAHVYAHRIDWPLSCDDNEESFHRRLDAELIALERGKP